MSRIGEEVSEQLDIVPAKVQVIRHVRPKYACKNKNCEGVKDDGPAVKIAPVTPQIILKSIASPGLLAYILTGKFIDHLPFYRQEKQFTRLGVEISRTSMYKWAMKAALACQPLLNLLQDEIQSGSYINIDETTLQVLLEPGRDPTSKSYMWVFRRGDPDKSVLLYQYHSTRSGDVTKAQGKKRKKGAADKGLSYIRKLYLLEQEARRKELTLDEIFQMRQERAKPILEKFKKWLVLKSVHTPPKGLLGKAVSYTLKQWDRLTGYIEDGHLAPDNNMAENAIRPFVVGRKNWLFAGTPEGAEASALLYSLIETAKANKLEPYAYLRYIFEKVPTAASLEDFEALLPWNITAEDMSCPQLLECT